MAFITGRNALVYAGGSVLPNRNSVDISMDQELSETRVFSATVSGGAWVNQSVGFRSWTATINGYYDDANEQALTVSLGAGGTVQQLVIYETRNDLTQYWYGNAFITFSESITVDGTIELNLDCTGDGPLSRIV